MVHGYSYESWKYYQLLRGANNNFLANKAINLTTSVNKDQHAATLLPTNYRARQCPNISLIASNCIPVQLFPLSRRFSQQKDELCQLRSSKHHVFRTTSKYLISPPPPMQLLPRTTQGNLCNKSASLSTKDRGVEHHKSNHNTPHHTTKNVYSSTTEGCLLGRAYRAAHLVKPTTDSVKLTRAPLRPPGQKHARHTPSDVRQYRCDM